MNGYSVGDTIAWYRDGDKCKDMSGGRVINFNAEQLVVSGTDGLVYWVNYDWVNTNT